MNSNWIKNAYGQFRTWFQAGGIYIVCAGGSYFYENEQWTLRGLFLAIWPTVIVYGFTWIDHRITKKIAGDLPPVKKEGE